jgi:hypothetical protein
MGLLIVLLLSVTTLAGAEPLISILGVRSGVSDAKNDEDFTFVEVFARTRLPWNGSIGKSWSFDSALEAGIGVLSSRNGDTGVVASAGPLVTASLRDSRWQLELGIKPTWFSEDRFGREDFGGHFHFTSHIGFNYRLDKRWQLSYRLQHTSNAGITRPNPGLNLHMLALDWSLD